MSFTKETCERELLPCALRCQKRPAAACHNIPRLMFMKRDQNLLKKTCKFFFTKETCEKDPLLCAIRCQKRPIYMATDV